MEGASTTSVDSKNEYNEKLECCATTNVSVEITKDSQKLNVPPQEKEYTAHSIVTGDIELLNGVTELSVVTPADYVKEKNDRKARYSKAVKDKLANGEVVDLGRAVDSGISLDDIRRINEENQKKREEIAR